ncbi:hypothetical protein LTR70_007179 [Exophiala xenobiotica]|uniref:Uncharacterized protein n=1 Tax=Lithohypha guttulata TaxID=1690604 RepID=A0ABR0KFF5_9EURO|nr:hypothetical protein LTR24_003266 [Lithohypha guttulata]KAK5314464.1 hypothetical protein LTR70_007179 [Exophiala xenobiotica]
MSVVSERESEVFSLRSLPQDRRSSFTSIRESIEYAAPVEKGCSVAIFDEAGEEESDHEISTTSFTLPCGRLRELPVELRSRLSRRNDQQTRWINYTGWSSSLVDSLSERFLDNHGCLDSHHGSNHSTGGPIKCRDGSHFVWIQNSVWFAPQMSQTWSSVQQCGFRMVIKLPTPRTAGTVITTFTGNQKVVEQVSRALTVKLLDDHSMGKEAMSCVWVLAGSIMRCIITQLARSFHTFDPLDRVRTIPEMDQLPFMLHQANELARIDRYTSGLSEVLGFFDAVRDFQQSQKPSGSCSNGPQKCYSRISERSNLESNLAKQKITHVQQLCRTYIKQYESHTQMMLSYSTARIAERLESGSKVGEKIAAIGIVLAAISGVTSPLAIVTGYFGMNVNSLVEGGKSTPFDFWSIALPVIAFSLVVIGTMALRLCSGAKITVNARAAWKVG